MMPRSVQQFTLGYIRYLNCVPFFGTLKEQGFQGRLIAGVPSELNRMLQQGELDASPSSSFEYAKNWQDYLLLPGHSISSIGKVTSVLLFSPVPPEHLGGRRIALTGESATSINLLEVLLRDCYQVSDVVTSIPAEPVETLIAQRQPALLIGNRALQCAAAKPPGMTVYDLGDIWYRHTGLPFVFALWMIRRDALPKYSRELDQLGQQLLRSRIEVLEHAEAFARDAAGTAGLPVELVIHHWRTIDYHLHPEHLEGLQLFFQLCFRYGLLDDIPELHFYSKRQPPEF